MPPPQPGRRSVSSGRAGHRKNAGPTTAVGELLQQVEQRLVGPVDVVDHRDQRRPARERREERTPRPVDLEATSRGSIGIRTRPSGSSTPDAVRERGRRLRRVRRDVRRDQLGTEPLDPLERHLRRVGVADVREPLQDLGERPVRHAVAVGQASAPHDRRRRIEPLCPPDELGDEPALAHARVPVDRDQVRLSLLGGALVEAPEELELTVASDHRRAEPRHATLGRARASAPRAGRPRRVAPCRGALGSPSSRNRKPRAARAVRSDTTIPPGSGALLEPGGDVHRVAGHHRVAGLGVGRGEDLAGVHAGPDLQRDAEAVIEFGVDLRRGARACGARPGAPGRGRPRARSETPNAAMTASPMNFSTVPPSASISSRIAPK